MSNTNKKKILVVNVILFAILFGLISFNKDTLRPLFKQDHYLSILTGSLPNFLAAFIISLTVVNAIITRKPKYNRQIVYISSILVCAILIFEEFHPLWGASTYYDVYDIIASVLGSLISIIIFEIIGFKSRNYKKSKLDK